MALWPIFTIPTAFPMFHGMVRTIITTPTCVPPKDISGEHQFNFPFYYDRGKTGFVCGRRLRFVHGLLAVKRFDFHAETGALLNTAPWASGRSLGKPRKPGKLWRDL